LTDKKSDAKADKETQTTARVQTMKAVVKKEDVKNEGANDTKDEEKKKEFQDAEV